MVVNYRKKRRARGLHILLLSAFFIAGVIISSVFGRIFLKSADNCDCNTDNPTVPMPINVPYISQYPDFPTGCEAASAVMLLNFYGCDISVEDFVDLYLDKSDSFYSENGIFYGPDPNEYFIGNPREANGYGCYEPVIEKAINNYPGAHKGARNTSGKSLEYLCKNYIDNGIPVLIWASIGMKETYPSEEWTLENGESFTWISGEHCLVLVGYDDGQYYFNDPLVKAAAGYDKTAVELRYEELGRQSLIIDIQ